MTDQPQPETTNQTQRRIVAPGTAVCPYCSTLIEPEAKTCPGCGAKKHVGATTLQDWTASIIICALFLLFAHDNHWHIYYLSISSPILDTISPLLIGVIAAIPAAIICKILFKNQITWIHNKKQNQIKKP